MWKSTIADAGFLAWKSSEDDWNENSRLLSKDAGVMSERDNEELNDDESRGKLNQSPSSSRYGLDVFVEPIPPYPAYNQSQFDAKYNRRYSRKRSVKGEVIRNIKWWGCSSSVIGLWSVLTACIPVLDWLPRYKFTKHILVDLLVGLTIAVMHIPQGMGYALLADVRPVMGLYTSLFPLLIYTFLGSSKHISIGPFAVVSLMTGRIISRTTPSPIIGQSTNNTQLDHIDTVSVQERESIALTVTCVVGLTQLFMCLLRLGILSTYLSDTLISAFTTGATVHVVTSQIKYVLGVTVPLRNNRVFLVLYSYYDVFNALPPANLGTMMVSGITLLFLVVVQEGINKPFKKSLRVPIPSELIAIVIGTSVSFYWQLSDHGVKIIGLVPTGLPSITVPRFSLMFDILVDSLAVAMVSYFVTISMGKLLAKKNNYSIRPNQELFALGTANFFGSFFNCLTCCASISRSVVQERAGGKSQIVSLFCCGVIVLVLLFIGPLFESLPIAVLSSIIIVALTGMLAQLKDFVSALDFSKYEAVVWMGTFLSVILLDVDLGLLIGCGISVITVVIRSQRSDIVDLCETKDRTGIFVDSRMYSEVNCMEGVKIVDFGWSLYFANKDKLVKHIHLIVNYEKRKSRMARAKKAELYQSGIIVTDGDDVSELSESINSKAESHVAESVFHIVIDASKWSFIDSAGIATLIQIIRELFEVEVDVYLANCSGDVQRYLKKSDDFEQLIEPVLYPSIDHCLAHIRQSRLT